MLRESRRHDNTSDAVLAKFSENRQDLHQWGCISMDELLVNSLVTQGTPQSRNEKSTYLRRSLSKLSARGAQMDSALGITSGSAASGMFESRYLTETMDDNANIELLMKAENGSLSVELYQEFLDFYLSYPGEHEVFDLLLQYEELCSDNAKVLMPLLEKCIPTQQRYKNINEALQALRHERNSWRLVRTLYEDRIERGNIDEEEMLMDSVGKRMSDKQIIEDYFVRNSTIRQAQLVVDWLEKNAADDFLHEYKDKLEYFSDQCISWEHTLHDLKEQRTSLDRPTRDSLITELDPDAPVRQRNNVLHAADREIESRLLRYMFMCVRCGNLEEAQRAAENFGCPWLAASLEGWRLYHDPNYSNKTLTEGQVLQPIEGNKYRDIWKVACWRMSQEPRIPMFQQALFGCLSGNLKAILPACINWSDYLWAYARVLVDKLMEQELHSTTQSIRPLEELPPEYWDKIPDFEQIFQEMQACPLESVRKEGQCHHQIIQKFVIMDDIDGLIEVMHSWCQQKDHGPSPHLLRVMAHLVLFFRMVGRVCKEELCVSILETYVKELIQQRRIPLVAYYCATLPPARQCFWYAKFLEGVTDAGDRQLCLKYAEEAGLDLPLITKAVVVNVRTKVSELTETSTISRTVTTAEDEHKISALDWLFFDPVQRAEAVKQANALMRVFVASEKLDAARQVFAKIPADSISMIMRHSKTGEQELFPEDDNAIREYLCFKAYLEAFDAFNDWFDHFEHAKPKRPEPPAGSNVKFKEKVAYEHRMRQYELELERWESSLMAQTKTTTDRLYNVLLFVNGGWMVDQRTEGVIDEGRQKQMALLRKLCIPQVTKLLHSVLHNTRQYKESLQLADIIASERHQLYKEFSVQELRQLLGTLRESSLALLGQNKDPLGYPIQPGTEYQ